MKEYGNERDRTRDDCRRDERYTCPAEMRSDETGTIEAVGDEVRDRLYPLGIRPGKRLTVRAKQPFRGPITVSVGRNVASVDYDYAHRIEVRVDDTRDGR